MNFVSGWHIDLKNIPNYDNIIKIIFKEEIEGWIIDKLLTLPDDQVSKKYKNFLLSNICPYTKNFVLDVKYNPKDGIGRMYPSRSLLYLVKTLKHTMFLHDGWKDIDLNKCWPTIMYEFGRTNGYDFKAIGFYIYHFDELVNMFKDFYSKELTADDVKQLFNDCSFGSPFNKWIDKILGKLEGKNLKKNEGNYYNYSSNKIYNLKTTNKHNFYLQYIKEVNTFISLIKENNPELVYKGLRYLESKKKDKTERRINNYLLLNVFGIIESYILSISYDYLVEKNIMKKGYGILEFDGICIPKFPLDVNINDIIYDLNVLIKLKTGFNMFFVHKDYKNIIELNLI